MPALVAMRFNPDLKAKYDQLNAAGKAPKVAITAIMRQLIVLANTLQAGQKMGAILYLTNADTLARESSTIEGVS
ncbi:hypothetical protein ASC97_30565 [Rhizobium sp. Root1203]|nr:hypothetical protein ASC97_30565 [Rhizobium sp. Root1203]